MEQKRTQAEARAHGELLTRLVEQEGRMRAALATAAAPSPVAAEAPDAPPTALELALDVDVVKWFKSLDDAWLFRVNAVLRAYARKDWR